MDFKTKRYNELMYGFNLLLTELNALPISKTTASYLDGIALPDINIQSILDKHKFDKSQHLPGFMDYLKLGINLSATMQNCNDTQTELESVVSIATNFAGTSQWYVNVPLISYSVKDKQFVINGKGKDTLDKAIIKLNKKQTEVFTKISDLHSLVSKELTAKGADEIFSDKVYYNGFNNDQFKAEDLINIIQKYS